MRINLFSLTENSHIYFNALQNSLKELVKFFIYEICYLETKWVKVIYKDDQLYLVHIWTNSLLELVSSFHAESPFHYHWVSELTI